MKNISHKIRIVLVMVFTVGIVTSCKDFLNINPKTSVGPDQVFSDVASTTNALIGVYSALGGDNGYGIRLTMYYPYDSDDMMGQGATPYPDNERRDIAHYNVQPSNTQLATPFNQLYLGVERANICIYYIPKMAAYSSGSASDQAALKKLYGEALTLRAQFYYELIRNWGDVPAQYLPSAFEKDLFKGRDDRNGIYDHILADLLEAEAYVPWRSQAGTTDERITQGAVRGLRARIALARGGYSLHDVTMTRASDYKTYYQIAKDECAAIMASGEHKLNPSFQAVFKNAITAHAQEPNGEIIWEIGMTGGSSGTGDSKLGYYNGTRSNGNGNGALTILPTYFYAFDKTDTRRDVTTALYDITNGVYSARTLVTMVDGKFRRDWMTNPTPAAGSTQQYFGLAWPVIRYSDVLLMYAEADNEIGNGPSGAAINALNAVRQRAFGANPIGTTPTAYATFFTYLMQERWFEFGGEGIRKYDLLRWNLLYTNLQATKASLTAMASLQAPYANIPLNMNFGVNITNYTVGGSTVWYNNADLSFRNSQTTPPPTPAASWTSITWVGAQPSTSTSPIPSTLLQYYAISFTPGKSELLPLASSVLDSNPNLKQNSNF